MNGSVSRSAKMEACAVRRCVVHYPPFTPHMGDERPAVERDNGTVKTISVPCLRPTASRSTFHPYAGGGFCKWR